ncbi:MAG: BamA/TamA family outer membrane protein, partial [Candidatus Zixiibacteriota bacterium]
KDYYEAEGGAVYTIFKPVSPLELEVRYRMEETKWLRAYRHLWSLFGGDKLFRPNFSTVDSAFREDGIADIDSLDNGYLTVRLDYDTHDKDDPFDKSAWHATGILEWSHPDLNSDFDYRRYTLTLRRYQELHRHAMLLLRGMYGGSDGDLPMYKRFYLGGLGTLRGFRHKEYMGTEFWMANAEYRIAFPRTDLAASLFWDAARIANQVKLDDDVEVRQCLGIGVYFGDDLRVNVAKRLDRSADDDAKIYVRLDHVF